MNGRLLNSGNARLRRRADHRRFEILRAAATVFRLRGFAAAGMRDIAIQADLSPGNLYRYFASKHEILFFCQSRTLDRLLAAADRVRAQQATPIPERLRALAAAHVLCLLDEVEGSAAHFEVAALPPGLRRAILMKRDLYEQSVRSLVETGIRRRQLARSDGTIATRAFLGALNWTAHWYRRDGPDSPERVAALVADFAVGGLAPADKSWRRRKSR